MIRFLLSFTVFISFSYTVFSKEYYELRTYKLNSPEKAAAFDKMMAAAVPLLATTELKSIGVFKARGDKSGDKNWRYVLKSCSSLDAIAESSSALANEGFLEQARDYLSYAKSDPSFSRISISTFVAFDGFPELIGPQKDKGGKRYFELRTYESHNELKAYMKVKMFNDGELDIFADVGLNGVFFGRALSGENLPNLTYMLVYDDEDQKKSAWSSFIKSPAWEEMKSEEMYKDTVSKIISTFLVPTVYSQIR